MGTIRSSAPARARDAHASSFQISSQIGDPELHAPECDRLRQRTRGEHPLLVEHAVIREIIFVAHRLDAAAVEQRHGIIDERRLAPGETDEHGGAAILGVARERLASLARRLLQSGLQHQVLDGIAGEEELGEGNEIGARPCGLRARLAGSPQIALDIAHHRVELRERELELVLDRMSHGRNLERKRPN